MTLAASIFQSIWWTSGSSIGGITLSGMFTLGGTFTLNGGVP